MKLIVSIVNNEDATLLIDKLSAAGYQASLNHSTGNILRNSQATVLIGVADDDVAAVLAIIKDICPTRTQYATSPPPMMHPGEIFAPSPREIEIQGARVFVLDVDEYHQF